LRSLFALLTSLSGIALLSLETLGADGANFSRITLKARFAPLTLDPLLTGGADFAIFPIVASLALRARIAALASLTLLANGSDLSSRTYVASLSLRTDLTDVALRPVLELGQAGPDHGVECGHGGLDLIVEHDQSSGGASDESLGLSLHQLDMALPLRRLVV
jgi:hypothetical protein